VTLSPVSLAVLATFGQSLELAGLLGSSFLQSSDLELWLRFCCFGRKAADNDANIVRSWTDGHTLSKVAQSTRLQIECFGHIVYHMDVSARRIDYERLDPLMEIAVSFATVRLVSACSNNRLMFPNRSANNCTNRAIDPVSNIPEFKICAVRLSKVDQPTDAIAMLEVQAGGVR